MQKHELVDNIDWLVSNLRIIKMEVTCPEKDRKIQHLIRSVDEFVERSDKVGQALQDLVNIFTAEYQAKIGYDE